MSKTEEALKERIKELTCLYEVSSIIVNADVDSLQETFRAIAISLKKAFQYPAKTSIDIQTKVSSFKTGIVDETLGLTSEIKLFNKVEGKIVAFNADAQSGFLIEEKQLLDNVALKIGNFLEMIEVQENEVLMKKQMERADRLAILGEITAGIAHELNTPLANILGFAELLEDSNEDKTVAEDLDKIIQNAIFSREVVKKLMFFACEMPQEMKKMNIVDSVKNAITLLDATFRKESVKYIVKIDETELWLRADPIQFTQIIFNLTINAIYFSPKDGLVTIEAFQNKKEIILKISDEGKGLSEEGLDKIFQPFFSTKPTGDGSGLGLSVVHGIVASHNGSIEATNNQKNGATFTIKFPKS